MLFPKAINASVIGMKIHSRGSWYILIGHVGGFSIRINSPNVEKLGSRQCQASSIEWLGEWGAEGPPSGYNVEQFNR